jgi:hypothetical protein
MDKTDIGGAYHMAPIYGREKVLFEMVEEPIPKTMSERYVSLPHKAAYLPGTA